MRLKLKLMVRALQKNDRCLMQEFFDKQKSRRLSLQLRSVNDISEAQLEKIESQGESKNEKIIAELKIENTKLQNQMKDIKV